MHVLLLSLLISISLTLTLNSPNVHGAAIDSSTKNGVFTKSTAFSVSNIGTGFANIATEFRDTIVKSRRHLIAGAVAKGVATLLLYPLDTWKTRSQLSIIQGSNIGLSGLYKGVLGSLIAQIPYGLLTFGSYEIYKSKLVASYPSVQPEALFVLAAIMGDITGSFWLCPFEVLKQRLQGGMHSNLGGAITAILKESGFIGLYRGYSSQILRDVPFRAISLPTFEILKSKYRAKYTEGRELKPLENLLVGILSGSFTAAVTTPLDVIKTRIMTSTDKTVSFSLGYVFQYGKQLYANEGISGLFRGFVVRVAYVGPAVGVFFLVYEMVKTILEEREKQEAGVGAGVGAGAGAGVGETTLAGQEL